MSGDVGAEVAAVLAAHLMGDYTHLFYDDPGTIDPPVRCRCGWRGPGSHEAHVADVLAPLIAVRVEAAKAEARQERDHCAAANERAERWKARCEEERAKVARVEVWALDHFGYPGPDNLLAALDPGPRA